MAESPFLEISPDQWIASNYAAFAIFDRFPVSPGHALVITRRVVPTWFEATPAEQAALMELVNVVKAKLDLLLDPRPDGYNVGFNSGDAAGQTVPHVHVHVIPRYSGDMEDPRGGVRHVIPGKGNYLVDSQGNRLPRQIPPGCSSARGTLIRRSGNTFPGGSRGPGSLIFWPPLCSSRGLM